VNKPVSTDQQTALDLKLDKTGDTLATVEYGKSNDASDSADIDLVPTTIMVHMTGLTAVRNLRSISSANTGKVILTNDTGFNLIIRNADGGAAAADQIQTGTGSDVVLAGGATAHFVTATSTPGWRMVGGVGSGGGEAVSAGKNYVINPDAANGVADVTSSATSGSWSLAQTVTAAELPEESKGSAFKISGAGLTVGDYIEWDLIATGIDDADGGRFGSAEVKVKDISGTSSGEYSLQVWDADNSVYLSDSVLIEGTGTYPIDVLMAAGANLKLRLVAEVVAPTDIGVSGVTVEPVSIQYGSLGGWKQYDETEVTITSTNSGGTITASLMPFKDPATGEWYVSGRVDHHGFTTATTSGTITIAGMTFDASGSTRRGVLVSSQSGTIGAQGYAISSENINWGSASNTSNISVAITNVKLTAKPTWADWDNTAPTVSDMLVENARMQVYADIASASDATPLTLTLNTDLKDKGFTLSSNQVIPQFSGAVRVSGKGLSSSTFGANGWFRLFNNGVEVDYLGRAVTGTASSALEFCLDVEKDDVLTVRTLGGLGAINANSTILFERMPDKTSRKASLPVSDVANETKQYLLPEYRETTIDLSTDPNAGDYTSGLIKVVRNGNTVTITGNGALAHPSLSVPASSAGLLPDWARPTGLADVYTVYAFASTFVAYFQVKLDGGISTTYYNWSGTGTTRTSTATAPVISYSLF
jgi:hypothetical protein